MPFVTVRSQMNQPSRTMDARVTMPGLKCRKLVPDYSMSAVWRTVPCLLHIRCAKIYAWSVVPTATNATNALAAPSSIANQRRSTRSSTGELQTFQVATDCVFARRTMQRQQQSPELRCSVLVTNGLEPPLSLVINHQEINAAPAMQVLISAAELCSCRRTQSDLPALANSAPTCRWAASDLVSLSQSRPCSYMAAHLLCLD